MALPTRVRSHRGIRLRRRRLLPRLVRPGQRELASSNRSAPTPTTAASGLPRGLHGSAAAFADAGGHRAIVYSRGDSGYPAPKRLYESMGFTPHTRTHTYAWPSRTSAAAPNNGGHVTPKSHRRHRRLGHQDSPLAERGPNETPGHRQGAGQQRGSLAERVPGTWPPMPTLPPDAMSCRCGPPSLGARATPGRPEGRETRDGIGDAAPRCGIRRRHGHSGPHSRRRPTRRAPPLFSTCHRPRSSPGRCPSLVVPPCPRPAR